MFIARQERATDYPRRERGHRRDVEHVGVSGAEHDDVRDRIGSARADRAGEVPAAAVADDRDPPPTLSAQPVDALEQPGVVARTASMVEADPRRGRPVADGAKEAPEQLQREVGHQKPRQQQHRAPVAVWHAVAAKGGIGQQVSELERPGQLADRVAAKRRISRAHRRMRRT
jgi:hypothetical protein